MLPISSSSKGLCYLISSLLLLGIGLTSGCKTIKPADAERAQLMGEYDQAASHYNTLYRRTPKRQVELRAFFAFRSAENYKRLGNTNRALTAYTNALRYKYPDSIVPLRIAESHQRLGRYAQAAKLYEAFLKDHPTDYFATIGLKSCQMAALNAQTHYKIAKATKWNSARGEFSPTYAPDGSAIYFSSSRSKDPSIEISAITGLKPNDLFVIKKDVRGVYGKPDSVPGGINTAEDEGTPSLSGEGKTLYYTYAERSELYSRTAKIYSAGSSGEGGWGKGQLMDLMKDSLMMTAHPSISPSGRWLYFVSDIGSSVGGKDIYRCSMSERTVGSPEHLGSDINTPGDEMFPYAVSDSILYFASNGHVGYGGFDIYRATLDSLGHWQVENMGQPINSAADDFGFAIDPSKKQPDDPIAERGLFSSTRGDARGWPHLFTFERPAILTYIEGFVYTREHEPIAEATIRIVGQDGSPQPGMVYTRKDGSYRIRVEGATDYVMLAGAKTYLNQYIRFSTDSAKTNDTYYVDFYLASRIRPEALRDIYYDFDRASLRPESRKSLDELVGILVDNPDVSIELASHTDRIGSDEYNLKLSDRRAQSVVDYLKAAGIAPDRLSWQGYGRAKPYKLSSADAAKHAFLSAGQILTDSLIATLTAEQRQIADQLNRRTEFKVLTEEEVVARKKAEEEKAARIKAEQEAAKAAEENQKAAKADEDTRKPKAEDVRKPPRITLETEFEPTPVQPDTVTRSIPIESDSVRPVPIGHSTPAKSDTNDTFILRNFAISQISKIKYEKNILGILL